ncbi:PfkB family carbohydrate kinase [Lacrimispora indolis]|uniref:PfkB family carbohydrate kinase n=1 Tax=Lacrimispora indolis TaxID=69825 RepID=UPI000429BDFB|nr:PfkB family carbohydrate kinase [[Clostridium] methoxybenzovorans]
MIRVLGLGDNVVDKYMHIMTMYPGGNALNFAVYAKLFGYEAGYMGNFGDDGEARHVYDTISALGLDVSRCRFWKGENGAAKVKLADGDRVFIGSNKGGVSLDHPLELTRLDMEYIAGYDMVHTSIFSYMEAQLPALKKAAAFLSMDFSNRASSEYLKETCPYIDCACISCGEDMAEEEIRDQISSIISYGCRSMVIATRGAKGAFVYVDGNIYQQSPCLVKAKDTMGAGDSFITCFLVSYLDGMKYAVDFPDGSGMWGITSGQEFKDLVIKTSLYKAAVYSSQNCQKDGSFGFGKKFEE